MDVKEPGPYSSTLHAKAAVTKATLIVVLFTRFLLLAVPRQEVCCR